jgi:hypothetical protein
MRYSILAIGAFSALALALPTADCTRELLQEAADSYIAAQTSGQIATLKSLSDTVAYTENDKTATIKTGILATPQKIDHSRSSLDTTACMTFTELIVNDAKNAHVIGTQMKFEGGKISKMATIVTSKGDWLFNVTGTLYWAKQETWDVIPEAKRDTRAVIQAAADAYLDIFHDKKVVVPWGTPCARLEGGSYTGKGSPTDSCNVGIPSGVELTNRRYVIDETVGAVDVFLSFAALPDSHEFRIQGGKIRYVHTMTVMGKN